MYICGVLMKALLCLIFLLLSESSAILIDILTYTSVNIYNAD